MTDSFSHSRYLFRKKVFRLFGGAFKVFSTDQRLLFYSEQKAFRWKEDFRIYADEGKQRELLTIKSPQIIDFSATYIVSDAATGQAVGAMRRKGLKSIVSDEWTFLSPDNQVLGLLKEKSLGGALLSRFIELIPQSYSIVDNSGRQIASIEQHFNPFVLKYTMSIHDANPPIDRRLLLAAGILLCGIEGRQG